jgi:hypothetical protein
MLTSVASMAANKPPSVARESTRQTMLHYAKRCLLEAFVALMAWNLTAILAPFSAMADPPDVNAGQGATGSQEAAGSQVLTANFKIGA